MNVGSNLLKQLTFSHSKGYFVIFVAYVDVTKILYCFRYSLLSILLSILTAIMFSQ